MSELIAAAHSSDSGHFYTRNGEPAYTIIGANGKVRPTTLRDCKKEGWVPSVTTVTKLLAAPGLQNWIIDQNILAALTIPRKVEVGVYESDEQYLARIKQDAKEQSQKAMAKGTAIHAMVQQGFEGRIGSDEAMSYYMAARKCVYDATGIGIWECEKSFARDGFGGKADLHCSSYLVDIKTKDSSLDNLKTWDEHAMQLAAYRHGLQLDGARGFILYINYQAECRLIEVESKELEKGWKMFNGLLDVWYAKSGLDRPIMLHEYAKRNRLTSESL